MGAKRGRSSNHTIATFRIIRAASPFLARNREPSIINGDIAMTWTGDARYNLRQLATIRDTLRAFEENEIHLGKVVDNLEALLQCLEGACPRWKVEVQRDLF